MALGVKRPHRLTCENSRTHLQDLIETTAQIHYEAFRSKQLLALKESQANPRAGP